MQPITRTLIIIAVSLTAACGSPEPAPTASVQEAIWSNGDFESDGIGATPPTGWSITTYQNAGISGTSTAPPSSFSALNLSSSTGTGKAETFVVGGTTLGQADPDLGTGQSFRYPLFGARAVRVNYKDATDSGKNKNANSLQQTMTVGASDVDPTDGQVHVRFAVAPVLENPSHGYTQQPYYYVELANVTRGTTLYHDFNVAGQSGVPWNTTTSVVTGNATQWLNWQLVDIAPGPAAIATGDQVKLTVVGSGCSLGGHFGRIYLDGIGPTVPGLYAWATGAQTASASSNLTYTFFYSNGGSGPGIGAHLDFVTPPQTSFVSASLGTSCTAPAVGATGTVSCPLGTLGAGASGTFTITVKIDATATGSIVNGNYSIGAVNAATLLGAKVTTTIPGSATSFANVSVTESANRTVASWGQTIQYFVKVANAGPTAISTGGLTVTDTMPAQLTGVTWTCSRSKGSSTTTKCGTSSGSGNISVRPKIGSGGELTYTVSGTITSGSGLGSITHTVTAGAQTTTTDPDPTNNTAVLTIPIGTSRTLSLTKSGGASNGTLSSSPSGISCGSACSSTTGTFADGSSVVLTATSIGGASFTSWSGACTGSARTCTVTMSGDQSVTASFAAAPAVGAAAYVYPYAGSGQLAPTGSAFTTPLAALVTDASGNVLSGITVTFAGPGSGAGAGFTSVTTTNAAGIATATATANATPGSYSATASVQSVPAPASFSLSNVGPATQLVYLTGGNVSDPQQAPVGGAFPSSLVAIARDAAGNPVPGATVTYTAPSSGASATLTATSVTSDANGMVQVGATANGVAGSYTITATLAGATPVTFSLQNLSPGPAAVIVVSGSNQSADPSTAFASPLTVVVADALGNALPNVTVAFAAPSSGAAATLDHTQVTTDSLGQASVNATANATAGTYTVSATVSGVTPATFTLVNNGTQFIDVLSGSPQDATVGASFGTPLVAVLTDSNGNPVSGVTVTFTAPAAGATASLSASTAVTDSSGLASVTATAGTVAGAYTVDASAPLAGNLASFALTNDSGPAASISAVSGGGQTATAGAGFAAPLVARVADASGNPVAGVTVTFAAPASGATASLGSATAVTDSSGLARVTPTAGTVAGSYSVSASVTGISGSASFSLTNLVGAAAAIAVSSGSPQSATVGTAFSPIVARVTDSNGSGVAGVTVSFTAPSTGATASVVATATTDSTGLASVTPTAGTVAGTYTLSATAGEVSGSADFSLTNLAGAAAAIAVDSGSPQSATVGTTFAPIAAKVTDSHGNPVSGTTVSFTAPTSGATATVAATATTNSAGLASATPTAGTVAGGYSVAASVTGIATPASFALTNTAGAASELVISSGDEQSARVNTTFAAALVVKAIDAHGNVVSGVSVTFAPPATGATAALSPTSATTGASGLASTSATAGTVAGAYSVTAGATGLAPVSFTLTDTAGTPAAIAISGGNSQSAMVHTAFAQPLAATVSDSYGNPVPGATVTFSAPGTGASATVASAVTNASGVASSTATANATAGSYSITGSITAGASVSYALTNTAAAPAAVTITAGGEQSTTVGTAFAQPLTVRVVDADGNPVPGATVTLTGPASGAGITASPITLTTGASGTASTSVTANHTSGSYAVAASVTGVATQPTVTLTNQPGPATALAVVSGDGQHATVAAAFASPLVVVATDSFDNLVPGATVTFSAPTSGATAALSPATATTGANGRTSTSATAGAHSGAFSVTASIPGASTSFALTSAPGAPAAIAIAGGDNQSATVHMAFAEPLAASVTDSYGNLVPGATVTFSAPGTGASAAVAPAVTNTSGVASSTATANAITGPYNVTASITGAQVSYALTNTAGSPAMVTITAGGEQSTTVGTAFAQAIAVRVVDADGNPVPGATVTLTGPPSGAGLATSPITVTTGASGTASASVTANHTAGGYGIAASVTGVATQPTVALTNLPATAASLAAVSGDAQHATVTTAYASPLVVVAKDSFGNLVPGATVTFSAPASGASASFAPASAATGASGQASTTATAGTHSGAVTVTASIPGASTTFALTNTPGAVAALTATGGDGQEAVVLVDFATPLAVHAADPYGNAVPGAHVSFSAPTSGASATFPGGATTDEHGDAQIIATAGSVTGSYLAQAASGSAPPVGFALTNLPGAAARIAVVDGTPQRATVAVAFAAPLRVVVKDAEDNVVPEATVAFSAPASSASAALGAPSAATGPDGIAQISAIANTVAGDYDVTASLATGASCAFHLTNTAGIPASITAAAGATPQRMTVALPYAEPLAVTVRDRYGNPVPGATVGYTVPGDGPSVTLSATTAITDATGGAAVDATANQLAGSFIVRAAVDGVADAAGFALGNIAGSPATLVIVEGDPQSATVDTDFAPLVVQVLDAFANPVPAAVVSFVASAGDATAVLASGSAQSDAGGLATMTAHAGTTAGAYTITGSLPAAASPVSFALTNTPGAAATITAAPSSTPQNAQVDHPFTRPLVALVLDAFANPVPGVTVTFAALATPATGALATTTATTGSDGRVSTTITAGTVAGTYAVTATAKDVATPASFALANLAGEAHTITASAGAGQSATVATGFAAPIVALVQDAHGNAVPEATVVFTAPTSGATASPAHAAVTTGADGMAQTALTCAHVAGAFAIIATTGGAAAPAEFALSALPGSPATATALASATPQATEVGQLFAHPLALAIADAYGNPVPGAHVAFAAPSAPGAQLSADTATTDAGGIASVLAIADRTAGWYRVTASIAGTADVPFELTNTAAAPSAVLVTGGGAQRTLATTAFAAPVTARVVDAFGNSIAGVAVAFSAPTTGATATMANPTPVSDASGDVSVALTAGPMVGRFLLSAQVAGATAPATTALEVIAIPTTITAGAPASMPINDDTDVTITVSAAIGTPGGMVDVVAADGTRLASAALDHGSATVAVSGLTVGGHTVTASYAAQGSYGPSASATVTFELTGDTGSLSGGGCSATGARGPGSLVGLGLAGLVALAIRRRRRSAGLLGLAAIITAGAAGTTGATASADPSARAIDRYHAAPPDSAWFALDSVTFAGEREVAVTLVSDYAREPLDVYDAGGAVRARVVRDALVGQLGGSVTLRDWLRLSAAAVMATWQNGPGGVYNGVHLPAPSFAFGDVTLAGDVRVVGAPGSALRIAVGLQLTTPTGQRTSYMSDATFAGEPRLLVAGSLGAVEYAGGASAYLRRETMFAGSSFGSELRYQAALGERLLDGKLLVGPELFGAASLDGHAAVGTPLELQLGGHYAASEHLRVGVGAGLGVVNALGEPHWRALVSLHWTP